MFLKDPKTGEQSVTLTAFVLGFLVATFKLLMSGITIHEAITFSNFNGVDYGAALGALGAIYVMRRKDTQGNSDDSSKS